MMRQRRDEEVNDIAEEAYRGAHHLLSDHRDLLDEIAERLLDQETIDHPEIAAIMASRRSEPVEEVSAPDEAEPAAEPSRSRVSGGAMPASADAEGPSRPPPPGREGAGGD